MKASPGGTQRFFEVVLPHLVVRDLHTYIQHQGALTFDIQGVGGWTFTFGSEEPVRPGLVDDAELALTFTAAAFDAFLDGSLDVGAAVRAREVSATGREFGLLEVFGRLLHPPSQNLGWASDE
ncbi:MAG: hypothetical protein ACYC8T_15560 [Myxococcaceae bacterium]